MEVHTLAEAVVDRIMDLEGRMRQPMMWQVTDVLLEYERMLRSAKNTLQDADMELLAAGLKRDNATRRRIKATLAELDDVR